MTSPPTLAVLLKSARRRSLAHLLIHLLVWTLAITLGVAAAVLLLGSEFLGWFWVPLTFVVSGITGWTLVRKHVPSDYQVAQEIDVRLRLADSLSTASYFEGAPRAAEESIRAAQHVYAERLAPSVDLKQALPLTRPGALYPAIGLAMAVVGLFAVRYTVTGSFDARPSLVRNAIDNFFSSPKQQALNARSSDGNQPGENDKEKAEVKDADFAGDSQFDPAAPEPQNPLTAENKDKPDKDGKRDDKTGGNNSPDKGDNKDGDKQKQDGADNNSQDAQANTDPSLLDKVKQAMNDLMNKMKSPNDPKNDQKNQKGDPQTDADKQPGQDGQSQDKNQSEGAEAEKNAQQSSDGENGKNSAQNKKSNEPQNGFGSQEGDKNTKQAEALKAMGKISELLGKRAENVKGSVTMEVGQTKQTLKTATTESARSHTESGGEIHRDTVPPAYEQFVQQYFEQVRKSNPTKPSPGAATPPAAQ